MSENTTETSAPQEGAEQQHDPETFDAEYVAKLRKEAAKYRTEAKANADAAKRLADIEQASKTEAERTAERITALERQLAEANTTALRASIASTYNIAAEDRDLFLTGTDEETLTVQAKRLAARESELKQNGNHVPAEGRNPSSEDGQLDRTFVRNLFAAAKE